MALKDAERRSLNGCQALRLERARRAAETLAERLDQLRAVCPEAMNGRIEKAADPATSFAEWAAEALAYIDTDPE